jgi:hypothetical protein
MDIKLNSQGVTSKCKELYYQNKDKLPNIVRAQLHKKFLTGEPMLTFYSDNGDSLSIIGGFTGGYKGDGPASTYEVMKDAGFDVTEEYITKHKSFDLTK